MEVLNRLESKDGAELTEVLHPNSIKNIKDFIDYFKVESLELDLLVIGGKPNQVYQEYINKVSLAETTDEFKEIEQQLIEFKKSLEKTINADYSRVFPTALTAYKGWIDFRIEQIKEQDSLLTYTLYFKYKDLLEVVRKEISLTQQTTEPELKPILQQPYTPKPCFKSELISSITKDLNTFFETSQHVELKRIIETGSNTQTKLLFRSNGNKLSDYFKKLFESNTITGCTKKDLIIWIVENFRYIYRGTENDYKPTTFEKTISGENNPCKNPIC